VQEQYKADEAAREMVFIGFRDSDFDCGAMGSFCFGSIKHLREPRRIGFGKVLGA